MYEEYNYYTKYIIENTNSKEKAKIQKTKCEIQTRKLYEEYNYYTKYIIENTNSKEKAKIQKTICEIQTRKLYEEYDGRSQEITTQNAR